MSEELFTKLRYAFQAGYTLPQFCEDKGIKNPLLVFEVGTECFIRELCAQFYYDRRFLPRYAFIDSDEERTIISLDAYLLATNVVLKKISVLRLEAFDKVIFLTKKKFNTKAKNLILFDELEKFVIKRAYLEIPLLHFCQRNPLVKVFHMNFAAGPGRYEGGLDFHRSLLTDRELLDILLKNKGKKDAPPIKTPFDKLGYTNAEVIELLTDPKSKRNADGTSSMIDDDHPFKQIHNGKRKTAYQPEQFRNKIYFIGPCYHYGSNTPYDKTLESYLQKMLNEANLPYRVENEGQLFFGRYIDMFYNLNAIKPNPGDIIFFHNMNIKSDLIPFCDLSDVFDPPHDYRDFYPTRIHVNELGYKVVAERIFKFLTENNFFRNVEFNYHMPPPCITDMVYLHNSRRAA